MVRVVREAVNQSLQERPHGEGYHVGGKVAECQPNPSPIPNPTPNPSRNPKPNPAGGFEPLVRVKGIWIGIGIRVRLGFGLEATPVAATSRRSP